ncbi:methyltransferase domain-containing protein [candidate division KSB1 bacterium]|nr:methyltransferase domain-containing protein [candidate division KSB1 bacterium]
MDAQQLIKRKLTAMRPAPKRLLDIGAGDGDFLRRLKTSLGVVALGVDPYTASSRNGKWDTLRMAAEEIDSLKQWFDVAYSVKSLHHFSQPDRFFDVLPSVLAWGGCFLLADWHSGAHTGVSERYYTLQQAVAMIEKSGLTILKKERFDDIFFIEAIPASWKIAVAVNDDEETICPKMFGMAPKLAVYSFAPANGFHLLEIHVNPYQKTKQHQKTFDVYELVHDCQALLSARIGKRAIVRLQDLGVRLYFAEGRVKENLAVCGFSI